MTDRRFAAGKGNPGSPATPVITLANSGEKTAGMCEKVTDGNPGLFWVAGKFGKKFGLGAG